jgi:hypothetical protein
MCTVSDLKREIDDTGNRAVEGEKRMAQRRIRGKTMRNLPAGSLD